MIKVVIADDIQILRQGLKAILEQDGDIEVTGLAGDGLQAFLLCKEKKPDVALMDMRMPEYDGAYAIRRIKEELPGVKILVLTTFDDRETVDAALENGADGYILKEMGLLQKRHLVGTLIEYDVLVLLRNTFIAGYDPGVSQLGWNVMTQSHGWVLARRSISAIRWGAEQRQSRCGSWCTV